MRIYKRKDSSNWWVMWSDRNGKRFRRSSGTADRKLAEALAASWIKEDFMEVHFGKKPDLAFSEVLLRYAKALKRKNPEHFMDKTRYRIKFLANRFEGCNVSDLTYRAIQEFVDERMETVSSGMVLTDVAYIKAAINLARREELTDFVPNFPRIKPSRPRNRWLTFEEEERLVDAAADHLKPIIRFAVDTGGRRSEILRLDWRYVDLANRRVTFVQTKNGEDRSVRLCQRAYETLESLGPKDTGPVFTYNGKALKGFKSSFDKARENSGVEDFRFHDLRHTFASRLVQGGVPLYDVMHLTGHKSLEMVQRYAHLAPEFQEAAIAVLDRRPDTKPTVSEDTVCHDIVTLPFDGHRAKGAKSLKENGAAWVT
jgi:integrase